MKPRGRLYLVTALLAAAVVAGCGESAVDPGFTNGSGEIALTGAIKDELNLHGTLLVASRGGLFAVSERGESFMLNPIGSSTANVEVCGTRIFMYYFGHIIEIDHSGAEIATVEVPDWIGYPIAFTALPDGGFAIYDCAVDSVYFVDSSGGFLHAVDMPGEDIPGHLQIMRGIVLDGKLVVSESGIGDIAEIDLGTYAVSVLRDFESPSPYGYYGDINHLGRYYYISRKQTLQRFTETGDLEDVAVFEDDYNLTSIAIMKHHAYVTLNFAGKVCKVNLSSGRTSLLLDGLDYPVDIEFLPVMLEPPAGP
jgi:hypothetical protein